MNRRFLMNTCSVGTLVQAVSITIEYWKSAFTKLAVGDMLNYNNILYEKAIEEGRIVVKEVTFYEPPKE